MNYKQVLLLYIIYLSIGFYIVLLGGGSTTSILFSIGYWLFPLPLILIGLFIGFILSIVTPRTDIDQKMYYWGHGGVFTITLLLVLGTMISSRIHNRKYGNTEANHELVNAMDDAGCTKAFEALENKFENKNSFYVTNIFADKRDSLISNTLKKTGNYYFTYYHTDQRKRILFSRCLVRDTVATVLYHDQEIAGSETYKRLLNRHLPSIRRMTEKDQRLMERLESLSK